MQKTLVVMATNAYDVAIVKDQIKALRWALQHPHEILVVQDVSAEPTYKLDCQVIRSQGRRHNAGAVGFKVNEGIAWALDHNIKFDMVMVLDDDALPIGKGIDDWAYETMEKDTGLFGVKDAEQSHQRYNSQHDVVREWLETEPPDEYVFYAVNFQPRKAVEKFHELGLLNLRWEDWPMPCESYQASITKMIGMNQQFWGQYPDNLVPPMYVMHHGSVKPPDPRSLSGDFTIHHSVRQVPNVDEWEIRRHYQKLRGENVARLML